MNDSELRTLFRITVTGWDQRDKYTGGVLLNLQSHTLKKVTSRWEERNINIKHRQLTFDGLYMWISLAVPLASRNNLYELSLDKKSIRLAGLLTETYEKATINKVSLVAPTTESMLQSLTLLSAFEPVNYLFQRGDSKASSN